MKTPIRAIAALSFLWSISIFTNTVQAQTTNAGFENAIVADFCDTFAKASSRITKQNMDVELGMMILPIFQKYKTQIESEWGFSLNNTKNYSAIGERLGQLAAVHCPAFQEYVKANINEISARTTDRRAAFNGKLVAIEGKPFTYILAQSKEGRTDKFYWLEFFPGAEKLTSAPAQYLNKPIQIDYREMEIYQAAEKEYRTIKVMTKLVF